MLQVLLRLLISSLILFSVITGKLLTKAGSGRDVVSSEEAQIVRDVARTKDTTTSRQIRGFGDGGRELRSRKMMMSAKGNIGGDVGEEVTKGERRVRRLLSHDREEDNVSGFVAFSEDYYQPTHHPPKNN